MLENKLLRHIEQLNRWNANNFCPLYIDGYRVGYLKGAMLEALGQWPELFDTSQRGVRFIDRDGSSEQRSEVLDEIVHALVEQGVVHQYLGEVYPVTGNGRTHVVATIDRSSAGYFGIRTYGQHLNGFVRTASGLKVWVARRAPDRVHFPDKLDNIVAGGLPFGLSLEQNLAKECFEEAGMPAHMVQQAHAVGAISYCRETETGLKPDTLLCYDIELPAGFVPKNTDGEVAGFELLPVEEVLRLVADTDEFKLNCNLVLIDFFIRHGVLTAEQPAYLDIIAGLHG